MTSRDRDAHVGRMVLDLMAAAPDDVEREIEVVRRDDPDLAARIRRALDAARDPTEHLLGAMPTLSGVVTGADGTLASSYRVLEPIGSGGSSIVFRGERLGDVPRRVAIKILRADLATDAMIAAVRQEMRRLATLSHPQVASVLDGGFTADGRPFIVMDFIDGEPITTAAAAQGLALGARVDLLIEASEAVQHLHRRGVIHCDLKPGNVLVSERDGALVPWIIDLGIAVDLTAPSVPNAATPGTPGAMSPEQCRGAVLDVRTDVYSVGRILADLSADAGGTVDRDLQAIIDRACADDRDHRYGSIPEFIAELRRWRTGHPVDARSIGALERGIKLARRRPGPTAALAITCAALLAASGVSTFFGLEEAAHRKRAEAASKESAALATIAGAMLDAARPLAGGRHDETMLDVVQRTEVRLEREIEAMDLERALAIGTHFAGLYADLGMTDASRALLAAITARHAEAGAPDTTTARHFHFLAARAARYASDSEVALRHAEWLEARIRIEPRADGPQSRPVALELANILTELGRYAEASARLDAMWAQRGALSPAVTVAIAASHARVLDRLGAFDDAALVLKEGARILETLPVNDPGTAIHRLAIEQGLAVQLVRQGDPVGAMPYFESCVRTSERLYGVDAPLTLTARQDHVACLCELGRDDPALQERCLAELRAVVDALVRSVGETSPMTVRSLYNAAGHHWLAGQMDDALRFARRCVAASEAAYGDAHVETAEARGLLGQITAAIEE